MPATLLFHQGTLILQNYSGEPDPMCLRWDSRSRQWRAKAIFYDEIVRWLQSKNVACLDSANEISRVNLSLRMNVDLYPYQQEAVQAWRRAGSRGSVCLPTGSGKTWVALKAMEAVGVSTLIIVPTLDLMNQWYDLVTNAFDVTAGLLGGGYHDIRDVTITTFDSASIHIDKYGNRFGLLIFDEVHHLPSPKNSFIPEMSIAPYRLGLTATYKRPDGLHGKLEQLVGNPVYEKSIRDLQGVHLAEYKTVKIRIKLTPQEETQYRCYQKIYLDFLRKKQIKFHGPDLETFLKESAHDPQARKALLARMQARQIIIGAKRKLEKLASLLKLHSRDRILIFTASNDLVYQISETFLIPAITHHTKTLERKWVLDAFRQGTLSVLVTSKVLNEGVDIPKANVAIILSGSASPLEHLQRLGRILRKGENKEAILYELVTGGTQETQISYRRRQSDAYK
ncbi:MAG: DEAD/DEAH box helicase family protein [Actinobacteria bacterium]|nr:DEAD/DEAH box helicase family protein [Actinomycetota bacterium]